MLHSGEGDRYALGGRPGEKMSTVPGLVWICRSSLGGNPAGHNPERPRELLAGALLCQ